MASESKRQLSEQLLTPKALLQQNKKTMMTFTISTYKTPALPLYPVAGKNFSSPAAYFAHFFIICLLANKVGYPGTATTHARTCYIHTQPHTHKRRNCLQEKISRLLLKVQLNTDTLKMKCRICIIVNHNSPVSAVIKSSNKFIRRLSHMATSRLGSPIAG